MNVTSRAAVGTTSDENPWAYRSPAVTMNPNHGCSSVTPVSWPVIVLVNCGPVGSVTTRPPDRMSPVCTFSKSATLVTIVRSPRSCWLKKLDDTSWFDGTRTATDAWRSQKAYSKPNTSWCRSNSGTLGPPNPWNTLLK